MKLRICFINLFWGVYLLAQGVSYIKYFATEEDFVRGSAMLATETGGRSHIQALYDKQDRVLSKTVVTAKGDIVEEEVYDYDLSGTLTRRAIRDGTGLTRKLYIYGGDEPMSDIFIRFAFPHRDKREFKERTVLYEFRSDGEIERYRFLSVDNREFGRISYSYFESGVLKKEEWTNTLSGKTVRLFNYQFNPHTREYRMAEYDSSGAVISRTAIVLPEKPFLDEQMPGISGDVPSASESILEESSEIIQDIMRRKSEGWDRKMISVGFPNKPFCSHRTSSIWRTAIRCGWICFISRTVLSAACSTAKVKYSLFLSPLSGRSRGAMGRSFTQSSTDNRRCIDLGFRKV